MRWKTKKRISINPKYVYIVLIICCLVFAFLSFRYKEKFAPVKTAVNNFITPMQKGISIVGKSIASKLDMFSDIEDLLKENEELKNKLAEIKNENQMLVQEKYELNRFRDLYELDRQYVDYKKVGARVISREPNSYCNEFIIDKGTEDGIAVDMNILAGNGLAGIITEVGQNWSRVRSIIDDSSSVSGMFLQTSDTCIVNGNLELLDSGYIDVEMINIDAEIYDNYEVVTSHISDKYLPGILIGYVSQIVADSGNMTQQAYLTPAVDFKHLEAVLIITELKEQLKDLTEE